MESDREASERLRLEAVSELRLDMLLKELTKRVMVVNDDALTHLQERGVIPFAARAGCCKPDGGTCCPNARMGFDTESNPRAREQ